MISARPVEKFLRETASCDRTPLSMPRAMIGILSGWHHMKLDEFCGKIRFVVLWSHGIVTIVPFNMLAMLHIFVSREEQSLKG